MPENDELTPQEIAYAKMIALLEQIKETIDKIEERLEEKRYDGIIETYEKTATTKQQTIAATIDPRTGKRKKWLWVQIINDSETQSVEIGVNLGSVNPLSIKPLESQRIQFGNKKVIEFVNYKAKSGTASIRIICAR